MLAKGPTGHSLKLLRRDRNYFMNRTLSLVLIGVLAACAIGFGYLYYQERQSGIDIKIDEKGISIDGN